jgi:hypothetical protein
MPVWIEVVRKQLGQEKMKRLNRIGETRWSGKSNAATTIFERFDDLSNFWFSSIFIYEILSLHLVTTSKALL